MSRMTQHDSNVSLAVFKSLYLFKHSGKMAYLNKTTSSSSIHIRVVTVNSPTAELSPQHPDPHWALSRETSLSSISTLVASCWIEVVVGQPHAAFGMLIRWVNVTWRRTKVRLRSAYWYPRALNHKRAFMPQLWTNTHFLQFKVIRNAKSIFLVSNIYIQPFRLRKSQGEVRPWSVFID